MIWINLLITLLILGLIFYVVWWGIQKAALGPPFDKVIIVLYVIAVVVVLVGVLTGHVNFPILNLK
jgi:hypothetical protein